MLGARAKGRVRAHVHRDHLLRSSALSGMQSALWHQSLFQARPRFARLARATHELDWVAAKTGAGGWSRDQMGRGIRHVLRRGVALQAGALSMTGWTRAA